MEYTINFLTEKKINEQRMYEVSLQDAQGVVTDKVSIWQFAKDGSSFPGFDGLMTGHKVTGNLWRSPKGYCTLFALKEGEEPKSQPTGTDKKARLKALLQEALALLN